MLNKGFAGAAVFLASLTCGAPPASSQLILSCYTLQNDLMNFDRRAQFGHRHVMPELEAARKDALRAKRYGDKTYCAGWPTESCESESPEELRKSMRYKKLNKRYLLSHLGGADPVRLRIIREMQKLECPLPDHVFRLLVLLEEEDY
jgi:hypothetical protein